MAEKQKLGVLCSGRGTYLQSIIDAIGRKAVDAEIAIVLADKPEAFALERAKKAGAVFSFMIFPLLGGSIPQRIVGWEGENMGFEVKRF